MLIDAICSTSPSNVQCDRMTREGLMRFSGNQWNEDWAWERAALEKMSDDELAATYAKYRG